MATLTSNKTETPIADHPDIHDYNQALNEVFVELKSHDGLRKRVNRPAPRPVASPPQRETAVERKCVEVEYDRPNGTGWLLRAFSIGCVVLCAVLFYRNMPVSWQTAVNPFVESPKPLVDPVQPSFATGPKQLLTKRIEDVRVGDRIAGRNPIREQAELVEPDPATWRHLSLYMTKGSGLGLWIELLRPEEWIAKYGAKTGGSIYLELHEMGAVGIAEVTAIGPCPKIQPGTGGTVVTGTFKHQADRHSNVVRLELEDQPERTGVTATHTYWSVDRRDFVEVGDLRIDELVDTEYGRKHVVSVTPVECDEFLYNLETTEHVYRVGSLGALVHNSCAETRFVDDVTVVDRRTGRQISGTADLKPTLDRIRSGGSFPHRNDGSVFRNREGRLPSKPPGYYTEYVHPTPGVNGPGPQRIVVGQAGEMFYTPDHYGTFIPINP